MPVIVCEKLHKYLQKIMSDVLFSFLRSISYLIVLNNERNALSFVDAQIGK